MFRDFLVWSRPVSSWRYKEVSMFDLSRNWSELPSLRESVEARVQTDMDALPPIDVQPPWEVPDTVVITAAVSGRIVRQESEERSAGFGLDHDSFVRAAVESIEAGACGIHLDILGIPKIWELGLTLPQAYSSLYKAITAGTSKDWICDANVLTGDTFEQNMFAITAGLAETVPMAPNFPVPWMESAAHVATEHGVRLVFSIHSAAEVDLANRLVLSKGILKQKPMWGILIGYPYDDSATRLATYVPHPKAMFSELINIVDRIREIDADADILVASAGRASQFMVTAAMLLGLDVRVGTEDTAFKFPHRNDLLASSKESVERAVATAAVLGRKVATAAEARDLLGLPGKRKKVA
jgi:3-keto-5-aminohexanoate cleavage enzyme